MNELLEFFRKIKETPQLYISEHPSYDEFLSFIGGYIRRLSETDSHISYFMMGFAEFVRDYYHVKSTLRGELTLIKLFTPMENQAFYKFFELMDKYVEYRAEHPLLSL